MWQCATLFTTWISRWECGRYCSARLFLLLLLLRGISRLRAQLWRSHDTGTERDEQLMEEKKKKKQEERHRKKGGCLQRAAAGEDALRAVTAGASDPERGRDPGVGRGDAKAPSGVPDKQPRAALAGGGEGTGGGQRDWAPSDSAAALPAAAAQERGADRGVTPVPQARDAVGQAAGSDEERRGASCEARVARLPLHKGTAMAPIRDAGSHSSTQAGLSQGSGGSQREGSPPWGSPSSLSSQGEGEPSLRTVWESVIVDGSDREAWPALSPQDAAAPGDGKQQPVPADTTTAVTTTSTASATVTSERVAMEGRSDTGHWDAWDSANAGPSDPAMWTAPTGFSSRHGYSLNGRNEHREKGRPDGPGRLFSSDAWERPQARGLDGVEGPGPSSWRPGSEAELSSGWGATEASSATTPWSQQQQKQPYSATGQGDGSDEDDDDDDDNGNVKPEVEGTQVKAEGAAAATWPGQGWASEPCPAGTVQGKDPGEEVGSVTAAEQPSDALVPSRDYDPRVLSNLGWGQTPVKQNAAWEAEELERSQQDAGGWKSPDEGPSGPLGHAGGTGGGWDEGGGSGRGPAWEESNWRGERGERGGWTGGNGGGGRGGGGGYPGASSGGSSRDSPSWDSESKTVAASVYGARGRQQRPGWGASGPTSAPSGNWAQDWENRQGGGSGGGGGGSGVWDGGEDREVLGGGGGVIPSGVVGMGNSPSGQGWGEVEGATWRPPGSWEESPADSLRRRPAVDDGTSAWGDPDAYNYKPVNMWGGRGEAGLPGGAKQDPQRRSPIPGAGPRMRRDGWEGPGGGPRAGGTGGPRGSSWDEDEAEIGVWGGGSDGGGHDPGFHYQGSSGWGGRRAPPHRGPPRGMNRHDDVRMQRLTRQLMDMGFPRDPAEEALKTNSMNLDMALSALLDRKADGTKRGSVDFSKFGPRHPLAKEAPLDRSAFFPDKGSGLFGGGCNVPPSRGMGHGPSPAQLRAQAPPPFVNPQVPAAQLLQYAMKNSGLNPALLPQVTPQTLASFSQLNQLQLAYQQLLLQQCPRPPGAAFRHQEQQVSRNISAMQQQQIQQRQLAQLLGGRPPGPPPGPAHGPPASSKPPPPLDGLSPTSLLDPSAFPMHPGSEGQRSPAFQTPHGLPFIPGNVMGAGPGPMGGGSGVMGGPGVMGGGMGVMPGGGAPYGRGPSLGSPGRRKSWRQGQPPGDRRAFSSSLGVGDFGGPLPGGPASVAVGSSPRDGMQPGQSRLRRWTLPHSLDGSGDGGPSMDHGTPCKHDSPLDDSPFDPYDLSPCRDMTSDPSECWSSSKAPGEKVSNGASSGSWPPEFHPGEPWKGLQSPEDSLDPSDTGDPSTLTSSSQADRCMFPSVSSVAVTAGGPPASPPLPPTALPCSSAWSLGGGSASPSVYRRAAYGGGGGSPSDLSATAKLHDIKSSWSTLGQAPPSLTSHDPWKVPKSSAPPTRPPPGLTNQKPTSPWGGPGNLWANAESRTLTPGGAWDNEVGSAPGGGRNSAWLVLRNLTPQIDGSTLQTLCMQHGPLLTFHLNLPQGSAHVHYSSRQEASKAQKSLHMCVLGNTTIVAELASEEEASRYLAQSPIVPSMGPPSTPSGWPTGPAQRSALGAGVTAVPPPFSRTSGGGGGNGIVGGSGGGVGLGRWNSDMPPPSPSLWGTPHYGTDTLWGVGAPKVGHEEPRGIPASSPLLPGDLLGGGDTH
ncbi:trinucleotide repeat-containing gene 6C protein-like isoform X2 [Petromyzon marinus]|uniref:trinucleotide repeat-containing gene 6C protein-like isoform X2 n=1 Tax=Petromyzon marinus TaxID=7757 RepID=UPI003F6E6C27